MIKKSLLTSALLLGTAAFISTSHAADSGAGSSIAATSERLGSWDNFRKQFENAFEIGDINRLEALKEMAISENLGFGNLNDLGGRFFRYGATLEQWPRLIEDAKKNIK